MKSQIKHLGVIMDGNRRWARKQNLAVWLGHKHGVKPLEALIQFCKDSEIKHLTIYALSLENLNRSELEVKYLLDLFFKEINTALPKLIDNNIKVRFLGDLSNLPENIIESVTNAINLTQDNNSLLLDILFCYGGQQEIVDAAKRLCLDVKNNVLDINDINQNLFEKYLWSGDNPGPCLVIRTGGALRISNFLLYKIAYSEFYFLDKLWPELNYDDLVEANRMYELRNKNFGR